MTASEFLAMEGTRYVPEPNSGCWLWLGILNDKGYGQGYKNGVRYSAHRTSYEALRGPIPAGLQIDHLCRTRCCVNPNHMEVVDCRTNLMRGNTAAAINSRKTHCLRGHEYTPENTIHERYGRSCRTCKRLSDRRRRERGRKA